MEGLHRGLCEDFRAGGIAIADAFEVGCTCDAHLDGVVSIGHKGAVLVEDVDGDEGHVFTISLEVLDRGTKVTCQLDLSGCTGSLDCLCADFFAILIIDHHFQLAWLILHVVPSQTVAINGRVVDIGDTPILAGTFLHLRILGDSALRLAVDEELGSGVVGVAIHGRHLSLATWESPVGHQVNGLFIRVPMGAVEIVAVLGQPRKVEDAEVGGTTRPVFIVGGGLAKIVEACPHKFSNHPILVLLQEPVLFGHIGPPTGFHVIAGALPVVVCLAIESLDGEFIDTT